MAAASTDPALRGARRVGDTASVLAVCAAGSACVLIAGGAAALSMRAGLHPHTSALWMSALALATMMGAPLLIARSTRRTTVATAATLIVTMSAMNELPAYLSGLQQGGLLAALMIAAGGALLFYWRQLSGTVPNERHHTNEPTQSTRAASTTALLALLAGMSSGSLARFQLFAVCGAGDVQPLWRHRALAGGGMRAGLLRRPLAQRPDAHGVVRCTRAADRDARHRR